MKLAILSDIHSNLEALTACLAHAERQGAQRHAFLGDLVGYGADPNACLDIVRQHAAAGAIVLRGNHDDAALGGLWEEMGFIARECVVWTRGRLNGEERAFIDGLPYAVTADDCLFVHASADRPERWEYLVTPRAVSRCLAAGAAVLTCAGHVHHPCLYFSTRGDVASFVPKPGMPIPLSARRRWLALIGSVGQPRDGNPKASYAILDIVRRQLTYHRVAYDWIRAAEKIRAAGLPERIAARLEQGR